MSISFGSILQIVVGVVFLAFGNPYGLAMIASGVLSVAAGFLMKQETSRTDERDSPTYGFTQYQNPVRGDSPLPIPYTANGHKTAPIWLQAFVTPRGHINDDEFTSLQRVPGQAISGLLAVAEGPVEDISDIRINGEPLYDVVTDREIGTGDGSKKQFRVSTKRLEFNSLEIVQLSGTTRTSFGHSVTTRSSKLGTGNGSKSIFSLNLNENVAQEFGLEFFTQNPQRSDFENFRITQTGAMAQLGVFPRAWLTSPTRVLVNTQAPYPNTFELWARWRERVLAAGMTLEREASTNDILVKFATAPASGVKILASFKRRAVGGIDIQLRFGTTDQLPIWGFDEIKNSQGVNQELVRNSFVTQETATEVDDIIVDLASGTNGIAAYDDEGEHGPWYVQFKIDIKLKVAVGVGTGQANFWNTWQAIPDPQGSRTKPRTKGKETFEIWGDSTSQLFWAYSVRGLLRKHLEKNPTNADAKRMLADFVRAKYEIRMTRVSANSGNTNPKFADDLFWTTFSEVTEEALNYPGIALLAFHGVANAKVNGRAPNITCRVKGRNTIFEYVNLGSASAGWRESATAQGNRVWAIVDLITNKRYGAGQHYTKEANIDIASAYAVAEKQVALVKKHPETTETEVRSRLDVVLDTRKSLMEHIRDLATPGRFWVVQQGNLFKFVMDDRVTLKTSLNADAVPLIEDDSSTRARTAKNSLIFTHDAIVSQITELQLTYLDENNEFEHKPVWVTPKEKTTEPRRIQRIQAYGITRATEATRYATFAWNFLRRNGPIGAMGVSPAGLHFEAGDVIRVKSVRSRTGDVFYVRVRKLEFSSDDFFLRLDTQFHSDADYAKEESDTGVKTTTSQTTASLGAPASTNGANARSSPVTATRRK